MKKKAEKVIPLPITVGDFELLIDQLMKKFKLPDRQHAIAIVANRIQHLPPDQSTSTLEYLGNCVLKNLAYQIAQQQGNKVQHIMQVDQLIAQLTSDPHDAQPRDMLEKAVASGSTYAKEQLDKFDQGPDYLKLAPPPTEEKSVAALSGRK